MITYKIVLGFFVCSSNGKRVSRMHQSEFKDKNPLKSRQKAIDETKRLISMECKNFLEQDTEKDQSTFYLIDLIYSPKKGIEYKIFGEESEILPSLAMEAKSLQKEMEIQTLRVFHLDGNKYEVLQSNLDFFI